MYLKYNKCNNRYGISEGGLWENDGLHCGAAFQVLIDDNWVDTRIEYSEGIMHSNGWYLVGLVKVPLDSLDVWYCE